MGLRHYFSRRKRERELEEELRAHRDMAEDEFRGAGMAEEEARFAARRSLGNVTAALEQSRAVWNLAWFESLMQDLRYAMRGFLRAPAFALTVVGTIGLALGLNTALFTLFNAYVLCPYAVHDPYSLYQFTWITRSGEGHGFKPKEFEQFRASNPAFEDALTSHTLITSANGQLIMTYVISSNAFIMLGTRAAMGRTLLPGDEYAVMLSDLSWKNKFGADPDILGKRFDLLGASYEVVGVAPPGFSGVTGVPPDFWIPLLTTGAQAEEGGQVIGRLRPGMPPAQAQAALDVWAKAATADLPQEQRAKGIRFVSAATPIRLTKPGFIVGITPIILAFGLVLLIACANVANMMLARAMARQREIGVRLSLGAGRVRLVRQLLTESLLLALPAAAAGIAISQAAIHLTNDLLTRTMPATFLQLFRMVPLEPDYRVFLFVFAAAVVSTLLFGLVPAIQATHPGVLHATRGDFSADIRPARMRNALVICQVTVCVLLLVCSGVLLHTGLKLQASDVRMVPEGVLELRFESAVYSKMAEKLRQEPWVESVAAAWRAPFRSSLLTLPVSTSGQNTMVRVGFNLVSPEYFDVLRIPVLRGRNFSSDEARSEAAVAIVSAATAARLWPGEDALGQSISIDPNVRGNAWTKVPAYHAARVIGIVGDVMSGWVWDGIDSTSVYFPTGPVDGSLLVRVKGDPDVSRRSLDAVLASVAPGAAAVVVPLDQALAVQVYPFRAAAWIASALGALALALSLSGIYGVLSYLVSQRTKEIGIRMALGASTGSVVRSVLGQSMKLAVIGVAIGALLALGVSRYFASELQSVDTFDTLAYLGGIGTALLAALAAGYVPSRRAASVDPVTALRCD